MIRKKGVWWDKGCVWRSIMLWVLDVVGLSIALQAGMRWEDKHDSTCDQLYYLSHENLSRTLRCCYSIIWLTNNQVTVSNRYYWVEMLDLQMPCAGAGPCVVRLQRWRWDPGNNLRSNYSQKLEARICNLHCVCAHAGWCWTQEAPKGLVFLSCPACQTEPIRGWISHKVNIIILHHALTIILSSLMFVHPISHIKPTCTHLLISAVYWRKCHSSFITCHIFIHNLSLFFFFLFCSFLLNIKTNRSWQDPLWWTLLVPPLALTPLYH